MNEHQISAYIDDQLDLTEKIAFVETVHADGGFKDEAVSLLRQELILRQAPAASAPQWRATIRPQWDGRRFWGWLRAVSWFGGGLVTAMLMASLFFKAGPLPQRHDYFRFVLYQPDARSAAIVGSFNHWKAVSMNHAGKAGYWEVTLDLPPGEYRYGFLLDGSRHIADPTREAREPDDFGGDNSILRIPSPAQV